MALIGILTFAGVRVSAQDAWKTITSKEGQFTVEMPAKPTINQTRVRKEDGANVKTILLGCKTDAGVYLTYKIIMTAAIVKGTEDAELDAERDGFAKEWNGKVIAEKRIRAGDKIGAISPSAANPKKARAP